MEAEKCPCGGVLDASTARLADYEVEALRCDSCGDIEINPEQMQLVLGHRKLEQRGTIETSVRGPSGGGKSAYLRLPPEVYQEAGVDPEEDHYIQSIQPGWVAVRLNEEADQIKPADVGTVGEGTAMKKHQEPAEASTRTEGIPQDDTPQEESTAQKPPEEH